ncbi:MAG TPA: ATP-binding protein [Thermoanaerobaculia bacterium]|nr:ATP-binding protein [Thermoanaerobaculia bacterium]
MSDRRLAELLAVNRAIAGTLDYEELLSLIVAKAAELTGAEICALLLADESGTARVAAQRGLSAEAAREFASPFDERIDGALRRLLCHQPEDDFLGVPVIRQGRVTGMLVVHRHGAWPAAPEEEELLTALADQAAISLDHAGRYRALWEESQQARSELEDAAHRKDEFLAMLSHELRNPLAAIVNALGVLRVRPTADAQVGRIQQLATRQAMHMKRLLDDLLDVSRVSRGKIALERRRVAAQDVVRQAVDATQHLFEGGRPALVLELPEDELCVDGDPDRLTQVVVNLLTNAAKYSGPEGRVALTLERVDGPGGGELELRVRDDGQGIAPELLPQVFDLFVQSGGGGDRAQGGLGIGLTLVRRLVELHGGRVEARSEGPGRGAELVVRLPLAVDLGAVAPAWPEPPSQRATPSRRVLLVEDNRDVADALAALLESEGHRVRVAGDAEMALEQVGREVPDLVLVDIGLPGMDGYELARRLRRQLAAHGLGGGGRGAEEPGTAEHRPGEGDPGAPVLVALTGYGAPEDRQRSDDAGFDHHLVKPVDWDQLRRLLGAPAAAAGSVA